MTTSQISVPVPRTWSPADLVTVPRLRADVSDAVALLTQRPYFVGQRTLGDSWPSGSALTLPMDAELTDSWNGHLAPPASGTDTYWCPLPGWYLADVRIPWLYSSTTPAPFYGGFQGRVNGSALTAVYGAASVNGSGNGTTSRAVDLIQQTVPGSPNGAGDYIQPLARQDSGSAVSFNSNSLNLPTCAVRWVSAISGTAGLPVPPLTAVPTPITSAWLNANVRDAASFLVYPPMARAHYTAGSATLANSTLTTPQVVPLTTSDVDTYSGLTTGSSAKYTAPVAGRYLLAGTVNLAAASTSTWRAAGVLVNGTTLYWGAVSRFAGSSITSGASVTRRIRLAAGDFVQLVAAQASGSAVAYSTAASNQTRLIALWEGL